jgi:hypothetical protein
MPATGFVIVDSSSEKNIPVDLFVQVTKWCSDEQAAALLLRNTERSKVNRRTTLTSLNT